MNLCDTYDDVSPMSLCVICAYIPSFGLFIRQRHAMLPNQTYNYPLLLNPIKKPMFIFQT